MGIRFDGLIPNRRWIEDKICIYVGFIYVRFFQVNEDPLVESSQEMLGLSRWVFFFDLFAVKFGRSI